MSEKIIDFKPYMSNDVKIYVDVMEKRTKDGRLIPISFVWEDGSEYDIDKVLDVRNAASLKAGGAGVRYTVKVRKKETFIYLEEDGGVLRWFMERK
jgi:hypothetical protein